VRLTATTRAIILRHLHILQPAAIYLFGSFGTARQHPASDIDLAILPTSPINPLDLFRIAGEISTTLNIDVDLLDLTTASTVMAKEVLRTGERISTSNLQAAREFEMRTLSDYARLNEERQPILVRPIA
jgi:predicted nucleotidyltransferase